MTPNTQNMNGLRHRLPQTLLDQAGAFADVLYPEQVHLSIGANIANLISAGEVVQARAVAESIIEHGMREGLVMTTDRNERGHLIAVRTKGSPVDKLAEVRSLLMRAEDLIELDQFDLDYDLITPLRTVLD